MNVIRYKTDGDVHPSGKPRVYFTSHPEDYAECFEKICAAIFQSHSCAVYYKENMSERIEDLDDTLGGSNLFVIPVTRKLLTTPNIAMDEELPCALSSGIPVLPIMMDEGLTHLYSRKDRFGELQYLCPNMWDPTGIPYEEKLKKYLNDVLLNDMMMMRIRSEFRAYVFLSYRKKDRRHANELMKQIHKEAECKDIAVWFDEFLTPGESFRENINRKLEHSQMFVLLVTPSILEESEGKPNFVIAEEYPAAQKQGLPVLPVEMETTDQEKLNKSFPQLPKCVTTKDGLWKERLLEHIPDRSANNNRSLSEHEYLIGLAYLEGIDMEIDRRRGIELITSAADRGWIEAARRLVSMYLEGIFVSKDLAKASFWQKKVMEQSLENSTRSSFAEDILDSADTIRMYVEIERSRTNRECSLDGMIDYCQKALLFGNKVLLKACGDLKAQALTSVTKTMRTLAILYELTDAYSASKQLYLKCIHTVEELSQDDTDEKSRLITLAQLAQFHHDYGILLQKAGDSREAAGELDTAIKLYEQIAQYSAAVFPMLVKIHATLVYICSQYDIELASRHSLMCVQKAQELYSKNPKIHDLTYANALFSHAYFLIESGSLDYDAQEKMCLLGIEIFEKHIGDSEHLVTSTYMNALYKLAGIYRRRGDIPKAITCYQKSIDVSEVIANTAEIQDRETIAHLFFDYATSMLSDLNNLSIDTARQYMQSALEKFQELVMVDSKNQGFVEQCRDILKALDQLEAELSEKTFDSSVLPPQKSEKQVFFEKYTLHYSAGDAAEQMQHYPKGLANYQEALKYLEQLKDLDETISMLLFSDLYDRLALCSEMTGQYDNAFRYYQTAATCALEAAKNGEKASDIVVSSLEKLGSFCNDYISDEAARKYYRLAAMARKHM